MKVILITEGRLEKEERHGREWNKKKVKKHGVCTCLAVYIYLS